MHSKSKAKLAAVAAAFSSGILALSYSAMAQDVVWNVNNAGNASGSWNAVGNWIGGVVPSGVDTADFSQQDVSGTSTITLDAPQSIADITFGDTNTTSSSAWVINSDSNPSDSTNLLTLTAPGYNIITVNEGVATINAQMTNGDNGDLELAKGGAGTLVLTGNNQNLTGTIAINNGVLELDFSQTWSPTTNILGDDGLGDAAASHVNFQGAELLIKGATGEANSQTFSAGTSLEIGASEIAFNQNGATNLSLGLGAITRNLYATIDVNLPTVGTVTASLGTSGNAYPDAAFGTQLGLGGLLEDTNGTPFATVNGGSDWAIINGSGDIAAASSNATFYTASTASSLSDNADVVTDVALTGSNSVSTMRFNGASSGHTVDLGGGTLATGGILMTPTAGSSVVIQNGTLTNNESGGGDTVISQNSTTNSMTISATIADSSSSQTQITKTGAGLLTLSGDNTYSGETVINGGTLDIVSGATVGTPFVFGNPLNANFQIAQAFGDTATVNISGGTLNAARTLMGGNEGNFAGGTGTLNQTGGTINSSQWFTVGGFGTGVFNMSGGVLNQNAATGTVLEISVFGTSNGTVNLSGNAQINSLNSGNIVFGSVNTTGNGTMNQNGGTITFYSDAGTTVGGTGQVLMGGGGTGIYTYNLNGGTLNTPAVSHVTGTANFNFNGGTLAATGNAAGFFGGLSSANVEAGGAIINSNGFNIGVAQPLLHAAALGATLDGGLTKNGAGTMLISGASTYTGATTINAGTLQLPSAAIPVPVATYSFDNMSTGVLNPGAVITNTGSGGAAMNGTVNINDWTGAGGGAASGITIVSGGPFAGSKSAQFDGAGTSIDIPSQIVDQSVGANWTFSAWVQTTTPGATLVSKNSGGDTWGSGNSVFYIGQTGAGDPWSNTGYPTAVRFGDGFIQGTPSGALATDGNWHMITYVDSGGNQSIYMDGVETTINVTGFGGTEIADFTRLGYNVDTFFAGDGNVNFAGNMDDLDFFNVGLNATQVEQLYTNNLVTGSSTGGQYLPANTPVNITASGASLDLNSQNQTIGSLAGVAGSSVLLGGGVLTTGGNNTSTIFAGSISGTGGLIKTGTGTQTLDGVNTYTGGTKVADATLVIGANGALAPGNVTIGDGNAVLQLAANTGGESISSLSILSGSFLDVGNNHVVISDPSGSIDATIRGYLANGYNNGNWNGTSGAATGGGIGTSSATGTKYGIGYADGADGGISGITSGQLEVKYTLYGDANLDGSVNSIDFGDLAANFGKSGKVWDQGDFNYDGTVNSIDFGLLAGNFGKSVGANADVTAADWAALDAFAAANGLTADVAVPEPVTASLLAIGAIGLLGRRRRRNQATA